MQLIYRRKLLLSWLDNWRTKLAYHATKPAMDCYSVGRGHTGWQVICLGAYQRELVALIEGYAQAEPQRYDGWLLDIGAHIGLISGQLGHCFSTIEMVEPNDIAAHVLQANIALMLPDHVSTRLHQFALGDQASQSELLMPKGNFGGAFIESGNRYNQLQLAEKDFFDEYRPENYLRRAIEVREARPFFRDFFKRQELNNAKTGVIKLDVEGFELSIIDAVLDEVPTGFDIKLVFENHEHALDVAQIQNHPAVKQVEALVMRERMPWVKYLGSRLCSLLRAQEYLLYPVSGIAPAGEIVATISTNQAA